MDNSKYTFGVSLRSGDSDFEEGLRAAVDYRGDVSLKLRDGTEVEGFLFNSFNGRLDIFPKNSPQKLSVESQDLESVTFSGEDQAAGKSWEDWIAKKQKAQPDHAQV